MNSTIHALVNQLQKRQKLSFRLRNIVLKDTVEGLSQSATGRHGLGKGIIHANARY